MTSFVTAFLVHLYIMVNGFLNHDSMFNFYADRAGAGSGRYTLQYLNGITSNFDLHYLNALVSIIYISLTVVLLVELFKITSKSLIALFSLLYVSYPTISATFAYMFTSDGYFLANFLTVLAIYLVFNLKRKWISFPIGAVLIYIALGTYQINIALALTLILFLFIRDNLVEKSIAYSRYLLASISVGLGLIVYVIHFKWYQSKSGLVAYNGIDKAGQISSESIRKAIENTFEDLQWYLFNDYQFVNLFEKLNITFIALCVVMIIIAFFVNRRSMLQIGSVIISIGVIPFVWYCIYFISPEVIYHILMKQHFVFLFIIGLVLIELFYVHKNQVIQLINIGMLILLAVIGFNHTIISNIYYEKMSDVNKQSDALFNRVVYDIERIEQYDQTMPIVIIGFPSRALSIADRYDEKTPWNVGAGNRIAYDYGSALNYMKNEVGLHNPVKYLAGKFIDENREQIDAMPVWPAKGSIEIINNTIVVNFGENEW